jgi:hypothetical protein
MVHGRRKFFIEKISKNPIILDQSKLTIKLKDDSARAPRIASCEILNMFVG